MQDSSRGEATGLSEEVGKVRLGQRGRWPRSQVAQHTQRNRGGKSQVCLGSSGSGCLERGAEREAE